MEQRYEFYIRSTPEQLWEAIVDPDARARYQFGVRMPRTGRPGRRSNCGRPTGRRCSAPGRWWSATRRTASCTP